MFLSLLGRTGVQTILASEIFPRIGVNGRSRVRRGRSRGVNPRRPAMASAICSATAVAPQMIPDFRRRGPAHRAGRGREPPCPGRVRDHAAVHEPGDRDGVEARPHARAPDDGADTFAVEPNLPGAARPMPSIGAQTDRSRRPARRSGALDVLGRYRAGARPRPRRRNGRARQRRRRAPSSPPPPSSRRAADPAPRERVERQRVPVVGARDQRLADSDDRGVDIRPPHIEKPLRVHHPSVSRPRWRRGTQAPGSSREDAASGARQILGDLAAGLPASTTSAASVGDRVGRTVRGDVELQAPPALRGGIGDRRSRGDALKPRGEDHAAGRDVPVADADRERRAVALHPRRTTCSAHRQAAAREPPARPRTRARYRSRRHLRRRLFPGPAETSIESCSAETSPSARCARPGRCGPPRGRGARRRAERAPSWPPGRHGRPPHRRLDVGVAHGHIEPDGRTPVDLHVSLRAIRRS